MIEHPCFYPFLSVEENLRYLNTLSPMERTRIAEVLSMVGLKDHAKKKPIPSHPDSNSDSDWR